MSRVTFIQLDSVLKILSKKSGIDYHLIFIGTVTNFHNIRSAYTGLKLLKMYNGLCQYNKESSPPESVTEYDDKNYLFPCIISMGPKPVTPRATAWKVHF